MPRRSSSGSIPDRRLPAVGRQPVQLDLQKAILDKDPHWYEKNILGTGPFKFTHYETGQSVTGVRNPDYYDPALPYLDGFTAIYADKQATRIDAIRSDRAAIEFSRHVALGARRAGRRAWR